MAIARKLKVFRTPTGFHDAYVAAPSRKAALAAWGSDHDLFARGVAEQVTDPALTAEPLANPGVVLKRSRGTAAEQIAALPDDPPAVRRAKSESESEPDAAPATRHRSHRPAAPPPRKRPPEPDRAAVERAATALEEAEARFVREQRDLTAREARLARERREMERAQARERRRLELARDRARTAYDAAMAAWRAG